MPSDDYQLRRKRVYRRRRAVVGFLVVVVLGAAFYLPMTLLAPVKSLTATTVTYTAPASVAPKAALPSYGASGIGAVGYDGLLASAGSSTPIPIASVTKIITALVVLDKKPLTAGKAGPAIPFTEADELIRQQYQSQNGEVYPIAVGSSMSQRDVMTVMLVASANNYARTLADWAFGSQDGFLAAAAKWLKAHGFATTTLDDPTGLDSDNRSTPADLVGIGKLALENPVIAKMIATKSTTMPVVGEIQNTNTLLGVSGIDGIKTGTLIPYGSSLLFSSDFRVAGTTITLVGVVLDGPDHPTIDTQIRKLIASVKPGFTSVPLATVGQRFGTYTTAWGATAPVVASRAASVVLWKGTPIAGDVTTTRVGLSPKGTKVGTATFTAKGREFTVPLVLGRAISDPGAWWRLTHPGDLF